MLISDSPRNLASHAFAFVMVHSFCKAESVMQTISISDLRANLLKYLEGASSGEQILVTSNGKPLASITAPEDKNDIAKEQLRALAVTAKIHDVIAPID
jgi:prevent-host-death family protein